MVSAHSAARDHDVHELEPEALDVAADELRLAARVARARKDPRQHAEALAEAYAGSWREETKTRLVSSRAHSVCRGELCARASS